MSSLDFQVEFIVRACWFVIAAHHNYENIDINGYSLLTVDYANNIKQGGVCIYFKEYLPLIWGNDLSNMKECLVTEIDANNEKYFLHACVGP